MEKKIKRMAELQAATGGLCLAAALLLLIIGLGAKYAGGHQLKWAEESAMYVFVWGVFLESGALVYEKRQFAFTALIEKIGNRKIKYLAELFGCLVKLTFCVMAVYYGCRLAARFFEGGEMYGLERGFLWLCLPVCGMTSVLYLVFQLWEQIKAEKKRLKELKEEVC